MSEEVQDRIEKMIKKSEAILNAGKNTWKKLTPIPPEYNGHGYEFYCTKCGYGTAYLGKEKYPPYECPQCGNGKVRDKE